LTTAVIFAERWFWTFNRWRRDAFLFAGTDTTPKVIIYFLIRDFILLLGK
jgi:hypothetical protein